MASIHQVFPTFTNNLHYLSKTEKNIGIRNNVEYCTLSRCREGRISNHKISSQYYSIVTSYFYFVWRRMAVLTFPKQVHIEFIRCNTFLKFKLGSNFLFPWHRTLKKKQTIKWMWFKIIFLIYNLWIRCHEESASLSLLWFLKAIN